MGDPLRRRHLPRKMLGRSQTLLPVGKQCAVVFYQQERGMANLKAIAMRLKSVTNIQKITSAVKMVSAAKYARAEKDLKAARPCGTVHSSICKAIKAEFNEKPNLDNVALLCVGDKSKAQLARLYSSKVLAVGTEIGRLPPQFGDASKIANTIMNSGYEYDTGKMFYNKFRSVVSYKTTELPLFSISTVEGSDKLAVYDSVDSDVLQCYMEYSLASMLFYALKEGACSEQSARMTAMDNSTKNAGEMIDKLRLTFNRTRQAAITGELIEIISGAAAL